MSDPRHNITNLFGRLLNLTHDSLQSLNFWKIYRLKRVHYVPDYRLIPIGQLRYRH